MYSQSSALEDTADVPYRDRIRALCLMMSVGKAKREDVKQGAAEAAIASVRSGEAFHGNVYSDSMEYVHWFPAWGLSNVYSILWIKVNMCVCIDVRGHVPWWPVTSSLKDSLG